MKKNKKRGISPVIATVLLVAMVVVIGLIIFLWFRGFVEEEGMKFGKNIRLVCEDVDFDASYSQGNLKIVNNGNVPIFRMKIKIFSEAGYETKDIKDFSDWPARGLNSGGSFSGNIGGYLSGKEKIILIPVLIGTSGKGEKVFKCEEQYGYEIDI
ncbi:hypothetical protein DRN69_04580 [Candidatus Pacearchaeota archaeon]|nr:MAG: hypothetical protein DRN69_04580 [Candidatus Pacearchaeota archaeon]